MRDIAEKLIKNISGEIIGKEDVIELAVITLLAEGNLLLEDVPGVGKTTLANALAKSISVGFTRIQFTPDTLPSDVTGLSVYNMSTGAFEYHKGAVMNNIVLADEINRTSPKTQSSLLEAMEEKQVTVDLATYKLPAPFMVIATQNPIDYLGTYNLPEAQLDRFMMKLSIGYPSVENEKLMVQSKLQNTQKSNLQAIADAKTVQIMQQEVKQVELHKDLTEYIINIVTQTRNNNNLMLGASPRATLALVRAAQAAAYIQERNFVIPEDILKVAQPVLAHRLILSSEARVNKQDAKSVLNSIISKIRIPVL